MCSVPEPSRVGGVLPLGPPAAQLSFSSGLVSQFRPRLRACHTAPSSSFLLSLRPAARPHRSPGHCVAVRRPPLPDSPGSVKCRRWCLKTPKLRGLRPPSSALPPGSFLTEDAASGLRTTSPLILHSAHLTSYFPGSDTPRTDRRFATESGHRERRDPQRGANPPTASARAPSGSPL